MANREVNKIPLRGTRGAGKFALLDADTYLLFSEIKWHITTHGYAACKRMVNGKDTTVFMHRLINKTPDGLFTDHINGNKLDNRRENLRTVTVRQNQYNKSAYRRAGKKSIYKGVSFHKHVGKFTAQIRVDGSLLFLGYFEQDVEAAKAYDAAAVLYHRDHARLNFAAGDHV
jgi:hypothetical protein